MSLNKKSSVGLVLGQPGSGKSASTVRLLVNEHIPNSSGMFITNLPLNVEAICRFFAKQYGMKEEAVRERIHIIPQAVIDEWKQSVSTPEMYFERVWEQFCEAKGIDPDDPEMVKQLHPLSRGRIVLDEARKILPRKPTKAQEKFVAAMFDWLATVRHEGCKIIFIAQGKKQLHAELFDLVGFQIHLTNLGDLPAPKLGIRMDTFCQLWAKIGGAYWQNILEVEYVAFGDELKEIKRTRWWLGPSIFQFYQSQNKEDGTEGQEELPEFERFGWPKFVRWLVLENWWGITWCTLTVIFFALAFWPFGLVFTGLRYGMDHASEWIIPESLRKQTDSQTASGGSDRSLPGSEKTLPTLAQESELIEQNEQLRATLKESLITVADLDAENKRLSEQLKASSQITLVDGQGIILVNGDRINEGETISAGPYRGRRVQGLDIRNRVAHLDDGTELRLRSFDGVHSEQLQPASMVAERVRPQPSQATSPDVLRPLPGNQPSGDGDGWYSIRQARQQGPTPAHVLVPVDQR